MKKLTVAVLIAALSAVTMTGCGANESAQSAAAGSGTADAEQSADAGAAAESAEEVTQEAAEEKAQETAEGGDSLEGKTTFTVGFDADFPPYGYVDDNGDYVGFDLDLAAEAASRLGLDVVYQPIDWDSKDMELESGAIDCIWNGFTMSEERLDTYTWSEPYVDNSQVIVTAADSGISALADLAGKTVCVQADSSALEALEDEEHAELRASFAELMQVPEYNTAFMNLEACAVDAIAMDVGVAKYQIESRNADFVILDEKLVSELYGVGFKKGNTELRDAVQGVLDDMAADGKLDEIAEKWGQEDTVILGR